MGNRALALLKEKAGVTMTPEVLMRAKVLVFYYHNE